MDCAVGLGVAMLGQSAKRQSGGIRDTTVPSGQDRVSKLHVTGQLLKSVQSGGTRATKLPSWQTVKSLAPLVGQSLGVQGKKAHPLSGFRPTIVDPSGQFRISGSHVDCWAFTS